MEEQVIVIDELPSAAKALFEDSTFFKKYSGGLPSPAQVRQKGIKINGSRARGSRPDPVSYEDQGLIVKYGSEITIAEAQCLWFFNRYMKNVPTPELFGWHQDAGETFIYMELVCGETLEVVWPSMTEEERRVICKELRDSVTTWRQLRQEKVPHFIGHIGYRGVGDIIFSDAGDANIGPFQNIKAFHDFFARYSCRRHPEWNPRRDFPELEGLTDDRQVVFTHGDLDKSNIIVAQQDGESQRHVVAIIDWHQSGWYPADWEWLKAEWRCDPLEGGYRDTAWLLQIMEPADQRYAMAWEYITSCL
ncbi:hypothetical protein JX265_007730 [Neoarthrinium moseri]|uniref:Aminoglycoside phosphotransferase domain-containing protein n=1 Tax=Neoarthrinium moseri TaxID=1658444 RepID=A0A9P9WJA7_9PEZI|nr:hypothetical protein JX265_007730 [Neoarthrinium moseri]